MGMCKRNNRRTSAKVNTFRKIDKSEHDDTKHDPYPVVPTMPHASQISNRDCTWQWRT